MRFQLQKSQKKWKSFGMSGYKWIKSEYFQTERYEKTTKKDKKRPLLYEKQEKMCKFDKKCTLWITMWKLWFSQKIRTKMFVDRLGDIKKEIKYAENKGVKKIFFDYIIVKIND